MRRENPLKTVPIGTVLMTAAMMLLVGLGVPPVGAYVYDPGTTHNLTISNNEEQVITGITVHDDRSPVYIKVGELVGAGAELDVKSSSYDITDGQSATQEEVRIENPDSTDATIIIEPSAIDGIGGFDLIISNIDTTGVGLDVGSSSTLERNIEYIIEQNGVRDRVSFSIYSTADVSIESYDHQEQIVKVQSVSLENQSSDYTVIWESDGNGNLTQALGQAKAKEGSFEIDVGSVEDDTDIVAAIHPGSVTPDYDTIYAIDSAFITIPVKLEVESLPVHYISETSSADNPNQSVIEIVFNTDIKKTGRISVELSDSETTIIDLNSSSELYDHKDGRVVLLASNFETNSGDQLFPNIRNMTIQDIEPLAEGYSIASQTYPVEFVPSTVSGSTNSVIAQGEQVGFEGLC